MAENCALVLISDEFGEISPANSPPLRFVIWGANIRHNRSRKSPLSMVPPGNWCEIFKVVAACAVPVPKRRMVGAASAEAMTWRGGVMGVSPMLFFLWG